MEEQDEQYEIDTELDEQTLADLPSISGSKKIFIAGGGSGGHITPLLAIATALRARDPGLTVATIGQKNERLQDAIEHDAIDANYSICSGKFRRYHGESFLSHVFDFKTILLNIRDFLRFLVGVFQAWRLLQRQRPDAVMLKGGFVCVPVGIAAALLRIPYITHDSDAVPGLANRLTAKWARYNTTAMNPDLYPYDKKKTVQVGIPLRKEFAKVRADEAAGFKRELGIDPKDRVLFCTGGGLGARKLNTHIVDMSKDLLGQHKDLEIIHLTGQKLYEETKKLYHQHLNEDLFNRVRVTDFFVDLYKLSGAADVIVSRAGATAIAEFAVQAKACIFVPNPVLTGGQQLHNAKVIVDTDAALVAPDDNPQQLYASIGMLLDSAQKRQQFATRLHEAMAVDDAAERIADILLKISC